MGGFAEFEAVDFIANCGCFFILLEFDALLELLSQSGEPLLLGITMARAGRDLPDVVISPVVRSPEQGHQFVGECLVALRAAEQAVLPELGEGHAAVWARGARSLVLLRQTALRHHHLFDDLARPAERLCVEDPHLPCVILA